MAGPCKVIYNNEEMSYEKFLGMLHDGLLKKLVDNEVLDPLEFKDHNWAINQAVKDGELTTEQRDAFLSGDAEQREAIIKSLESEEAGATTPDQIKSVLEKADSILGAAEQRAATGAAEPKKTKAGKAAAKQAAADAGAISSTPEQQEEHYSTTSGATPNQNTGRIPVSPIVGGKVKAIKDILLDVSQKLKQKLRYEKTGRGSAGSYSPGNTAVKIRFNGDMDVTAHELGHSIDDLYGVLSDMKNNPDPTIDAELSKFSPYGSKPPANHPDPKMYERAEGFAEWLRAFVLNPDEAIAQAPELYKLYKDKVSQEYQDALIDFSNDVRGWAGMSGSDMIGSNMQMEPPKGTILEKLFGKQDKTNEFKFGFAGRLAANYVNPLQAFNKAVKYAMGLKGIDEVIPENDPRVAIRLLAGFNGKFDDFMNNGFRDADNKILKDKNGKAKNLDWLLDPLDNTDESTIKKDQEDVMKYMVAQRTIEYAKKFGRTNKLTGIGGGIKNDLDVAMKAMNEFENGDPNRLIRIKKAAERYRELADDVLKYMVDKGTLSKEGYQKIKNDNEYYAAMHRVMELSPGEELDTNFGQSAGLGSKPSTLKAAKGGTETIGNIYSNLIDSMHRSIKEADQNDVLVSFRNMLVEPRRMYQGEPKRFADVGHIGKQGDKNAIPIMIDGKTEYWVFQKDVYNSIKGITDAVKELPGIFTMFPKALRWTVTHYPTFAVRNMARDLQDRLIKSGDGSGFRTMVGDKQHWSDIAAMGGLQSGHYLKSAESYYGLQQEAINRLAKDKGTILTDPTKFKQVWKTYENWLQSAETINRVAEYRKAFEEGKKKGYDDYNASMYAAYKSRDLMDFALIGHHMKYLNQLIPFSNAAVQGLRKTALSAKEQPLKFASKMLIYSVLPGAAVWIFNHKDEKSAEEYESLPSFQRDMFWNFKVGSQWVSIPKPFELALPGAGVDRIMSKMYGNKDAFQGYAGSVAKGVLPVDQANIIPVAPSLVENMMNYDLFRDGTIIPPSENTADLSLRNTDKASRLGKFLQDNTGWDARKWDHFVKGQFSYVGGAALKLSNIGREDGEKFGIKDIGFFKDTPLYNAPKVQEFMEYADRWQLNQSRTMRHFKSMLSDWKEEKDQKRKDDLARTIRDFAKLSLEEWKASNISEKKQERFETRKERRTRR